MNRSTQIDELVGTADLNVSDDLYDTDEPPKDQSWNFWQYWLCWLMENRGVNEGMCLGEVIQRLDKDKMEVSQRLDIKDKMEVPWGIIMILSNYVPYLTHNKLSQSRCW